MLLGSSEQGQLEKTNHTAGRNLRCSTPLPPSQMAPHLISWQNQKHIFFLNELKIKMEELKTLIINAFLKRDPSLGLSFQCLIFLFGQAGRGFCVYCTL